MSIKMTDRELELAKRAAVRLHNQNKGVVQFPAAPELDEDDTTVDAYDCWRHGVALPVPNCSMDDENSCDETAALQGLYARYLPSKSKLRRFKIATDAELDAWATSLYDSLQ